MQVQALNRREAIKLILASLGATLGGSLLSACVPGDPTRLLAPCEPTRDTNALGWVPSVLAPVLHGYADYTTSIGAPANVRVFYPSLIGNPGCAPILASAGRFPLVMFLHGQCASDSLHYTKWYSLPALLARSGFIVAIPDLTGIHYAWDLDNVIYRRIRSVINWVREEWSHRDSVLEAPTLGIVGHSYGALHGGQLALEIPATAYISLSGGWNEWPLSLTSPLLALAVPKLLVWGTEDLLSAILMDESWNQLTTPKYRLVFTGGGHSDYLSPSITSCGPTTGPCEHAADLTADYTALFLSKYMSPERARVLTESIPDNLIPGELELTREQRLFAEVYGHLRSFEVDGSSSTCTGTLSWQTGPLPRPGRR